mmetsp:Transcript_20258/g.60496  ORF Transcript_20258/g.60496 Transcript_20258/m.60496 type:complete len:969 (-) Transcript_20258:543-3449(-)
MRVGEWFGLSMCIVAVGTRAHTLEAALNPFVQGDARFTVLSSALIRLELRRHGAPFDDRPTLAMPGGGTVPNPPPRASVAHPAEGVITITTDALTLRYDASAEDSGDFSPTSLSIAVASDVAGTPPLLWHPGDNASGNLGGTRLDLGCYDTFDACYSNGLGWGPISRDGWALWDDTAAVRMHTVPHPAVGFPWFDSSVPCDPAGVCSTTTKDWYFFGHGHRYSAALNDFAMVSGRSALPPLAAFGVWWSTWYAFSEQELTSTVLQAYRDHGLPLDVVVLDMDWHTEPTQKNCTSWGGFTWNTNLFPDPDGFQDFLHSDRNPLGHPLATLLNGHPDSGIGPCQANYSAMCRRIGANPADNALLKCNMSSAEWASALFDTMLDPKGIDYWWTDYRGCASPTSGVLPLPSSSGCPQARQTASETAALLWSNYVYSEQIAKTGRRPLVLSRYGGLGNQRYGIGFSGDTESTWSTLRYQVEMTPTAANVLQSYWSHDLGGYNIYCPSDPHTIAPCKCGTVIEPCNITTNQCAKADGELYTRWLQFGALSPIFRTHCSHCDRRIWMYPQRQFEAMKAAMLFRDALVPYVYTAARRAYDQAVAPVHPLYYTFPEVPHAYDFAADQYFFGEALLVAPITTDGTASRQASRCVPKVNLGCFIDSTDRLEPVWSSGNSPTETLKSCATECGAVHSSIFMAIESGGSNQETQCYCGNNAPPVSRKAPNTDCSTPCAGNKSEACGGVWRANVWSIECTTLPPTPAPVGGGKTVWLPPGTWTPWNATMLLTSHAVSGTVMTNLHYSLDEIPLFVKGGAVVPTRSMSNGTAARPTVWILFPGSSNGSGVLYEDDGVSTKYADATPPGVGHNDQSSDGGDAANWTTLSFSSKGAASLNITISSGRGTSRNILQIRRLPGSPQPLRITCGAETLPRIDPPAEGFSGTGWWLATRPVLPSFMSAAGAIMVATPETADEAHVTVYF